MINQYCYQTTKQKNLKYPGLQHQLPVIKILFYKKREANVPGASSLKIF